MEIAVLVEIYSWSLGLIPINSISYFLDLVKFLNVGMKYSGLHRTLCDYVRIHRKSLCMEIYLTMRDYTKLYIMPVWNCMRMHRLDFGRLYGKNLDTRFYRTS